MVSASNVNRSPQTKGGVSVCNIRKAFSGREVLGNVSLAVEKGRALAILGPSGSGKTTILRCINLLCPIDGGRILLDGMTVAEVDDRSHEMRVASDLSAVRRRIGMVFQEWNLWPNKTVRDNVAEGPRFVLGQSRQEAHGLAAKMCASVGLEEKLNAYPHELSGGQKQRAAIARALAMDPDVMMLDEVTSALDPSLVVEVLDVMQQLKDERRALLVVTHHVEFAKAIADEVAFLWNGRIHEVGPARETLDSPRTAELQSFLKTLEMTH